MRVAHFEHLALALERNALAAQGGAQIVHVQHAEAVADDRFGQVGGGLTRRLRCFNDVIHDSPRSDGRSEEHTSELQSLMRISYAVFCLKTKKQTDTERKSSAENATLTPSKSQTEKQHKES